MRSGADDAGAQLCGDPLALASALARIENAARVRAGLGATPAETSAFASLYVAAPFAGRLELAGLFSTHPPTHQRIRRLQALARRRMGLVGVG